MSEFPSLRLNNIPLYVYTTLFISMNSGDYFNLLATVNNATSVSVQKPQDPPFSSLGIYPEMKLLDQMASLFLNF